MRLLDAKLSEDGCSTELLSVIKTVLAGCKKISNILSSGDFSYIPLDSFGFNKLMKKNPSIQSQITFSKIYSSTFVS